jgi:hypothetical protein
MTRILRLASGLNRVLKFSRASRKEMTVLQLPISKLRLERFLLQSLRADLSLLSLEEITLVELGLDTSASQLFCTVSKKTSCSRQKFSNLKIFDLGILELTETLQGI